MALSSEAQEVEIACECCGAPSDDRRITIEGSFGHPLTMLCDLCKGLIESGMLRPEYVGDRKVYRQWIFEQRPGELLPRFR